MSYYSKYVDFKNIYKKYGVVTNYPINMNHHSIKNVAQPVLKSDAANKNYVDTSLEKIKEYTNELVKSQKNIKVGSINGLEIMGEAVDTEVIRFDLDSGFQLTDLGEKV